ncbi:aldehyde dehydrogenase family protein [Bosea sp. (in: a-proteobacteria)]|uniref:aldehyde dehydrogenase family protein n=1 Tax=Bosea sp. (in: a-proteobacteria) TaxID=1871050 RepID=UPI002627DB85|nr:aldehyde dehydrogenase family protein [Bosea sp. (in: a-proteobacteria)]MCO5090366.1 aldehyde dehydrogenase family protein [Bosea sp. (in: a-proteobacteria)]
MSIAPAAPRASLPSTPTDYASLIGGNRVGAAGHVSIERRNPAHGVVVSRYPQATARDVAAAVEAARKAADSRVWSGMPGAERARIIARVAQLIDRDRAGLGLIESLEVGKPIGLIDREIGGSVALWEYAATLARHTYGDSYDQLGAQTMALVLRQPVGVVGMITPWNYPLLIVSQKLPFALAVGCCAVVKPSELTSGTALRLADILIEAGVPPGVVNIVAGYGNDTGRAITEHPALDMISFTGSTRVGREIGRLGGEALKKVSLELGGKSAHIVCADADLDAAAEKVVLGFTRNAGQACVSGSRLLVERSVATRFTEAVIAHAKALKVGDPLDPQTQMGPLVSEAQRDRVTGYITAGSDAGAKGWSREAGPEAALPGHFVQPTVFTEVAPSMSIAQEEIFGPVLCVMPFDSVAEAVGIANGTIYGLAAGIWTRDLDKAFLFGRSLKAGTIEVNTFLAGAPELPLTGHGQSGVGHEKGRYAIEEFTELKTIQLQFGSAPL